MTTTNLVGTVLNSVGEPMANEVIKVQLVENQPTLFHQSVTIDNYAGYRFTLDENGSFVSAVIATPDVERTFWKYRVIFPSGREIVTILGHHDQPEVDFNILMRRAGTYNVTYGHEQGYLGQKQVVRNREIANVQDDHIMVVYNPFVIEPGGKLTIEERGKVVIDDLITAASAGSTAHYRPPYTEYTFKLWFEEVDFVWETRIDELYNNTGVTWTWTQENAGGAPFWVDGIPSDTIDYTNTVVIVSPVFTTLPTFNTVDLRPSIEDEFASSIQLFSYVNGTNVPLDGLVGRIPITIRIYE